MGATKEELPTKPLHLKEPEGRQSSINQTAVVSFSCFWRPPEGPVHHAYRQAFGVVSDWDSGSDRQQPQDLGRHVQLRQMVSNRITLQTEGDKGRQSIPLLPSTTVDSN